MDLELNRINYIDLPANIKKLAQVGVPDVFVCLPEGAGLDLRRAEKYIYQALDLEDELGIWLVNWPHCAVGFWARDHIVNRGRSTGEKTPRCADCKYNEFCSGFPPGYFRKYGRRSAEPVKDIPLEVMVEVEPRCNFDCAHCFNRSSFAANGRNIASLKTAQIKNIIRQVNKMGTGIIRFTGGEPMLRDDIFDLAKYAKSRGLEVRINTNGSLIDKEAAGRMRGSVDNILLSFNACGQKDDERISGYPASWRKKLEAVKMLKKNKIPVVRGGTIANSHNIKNIFKFVKIARVLGLDEWEMYRPMSSRDYREALSVGDVVKLAAKLSVVRKKAEMKISFANALPFCVMPDKKILNNLSAGALFDDGHHRLVVDARGHVKPDYYFKKKMGYYEDLAGAWNNSFMKKMRALGFLPEICHNCLYKYKCRGGSRHEAFINSGSYISTDPLAKYY